MIWHVWNDLEYEKVLINLCVAICLCAVFVCVCVCVCVGACVGVFNTRI
jgi:hypothetical protein